MRYNKNVVIIMVFIMKMWFIIKAVKGKVQSSDFHGNVYMDMLTALC